jgi:DNA-binding MarR family transcriptional regulator
LTVQPEYPLGPPLIGALMRMPLDAVLARILVGLHDAGFTDLVPAHLAVLQYPGPEHRRPSELAADARMSKQAMNYLLGQMEQLGYLTRDDDPEDQRSKRIHLTERGHAAARAIRETVTEIEAEFEQELGAARFDQLRQLLVHLNSSSIVREFRQGQPGTTRRSIQPVGWTRPTGHDRPR